MTTPKSKLERREDRADLTLLTPNVVHGRREGGISTPSTPTPMSQRISTCIPVYQPSGRLSVPADDLATLRAIVEDEGGSLDFEETSERGFICGDCQGLPVFKLGVTLPDNVDPNAVLEQLHPAVKAMIRRNLTPVPATQLA